MWFVYDEAVKYQVSSMISFTHWLERHLTDYPNAVHHFTHLLFWSLEGLCLSQPIGGREYSDVFSKRLCILWRSKERSISRFIQTQ